MNYTKEQLENALRIADELELQNSRSILAAAYRDQAAMVDQLKAALDKALAENLAMRSKPNHLGA